MIVETWSEPWPSAPASGSQPVSSGRQYALFDAGQGPTAQVRIAGSRLELRRLGGLLGTTEEAWELPVAWTSTTLSETPHVRLNWTTSEGRQTAVVPVSRPPITEVQLDEEDDSAESWVVPPEIEGLLGHHVEAIRTWLDGDDELAQRLAVDSSHHCIAPLAEFCHHYWDQERPQDAPLDLIVRIARDCLLVMERLAWRPRRILRRDRRLVPVGSAQQLDASCLRWITRQPGRTIAERAGPRQRIQAVVREPSTDTPENRVLREFLQLARGAASRYLAANKKFTHSARVVDVRRLFSVVTRALRFSDVRFVPRLVGMPEPNYVLQFDPDYNVIWNWFVRLRRQEQEKDDLRSWHQRVWDERSLLAVLATMEMIAQPTGSFRGRVALRREAAFGAFVDSGTTAGPWVCRGTKPGLVLRLVHRDEFGDHASLRPWLALGVERALVIQNVFDRSRIHAVLPILTLFAPDDSEQDFSERLERLDAEASRVATDSAWSLLLLTPEREGARSLIQSRSQRIVGCRIPLPAAQGASAGWAGLQKCLQIFVAWGPPA